LSLCQLVLVEVELELVPRWGQWSRETTQVSGLQGPVPEYLLERRFPKSSSPAHQKYSTTSPSNRSRVREPELSMLMCQAPLHLMWGLCLAAG
jgi:hypothetical protein